MDAQKLFNDTALWATHQGWMDQSQNLELPKYSEKAQKIVSHIRRGDWGCAKRRVYDLVVMVLDEPLPPFEGDEEENGRYDSEKWFGRTDEHGTHHDPEFDMDDTILVAIDGDVTDTDHEMKPDTLLLIDQDCDVSGDTVEDAMTMSGIRTSTAIQVRDIRPATYEECRRVAWRFRDLEEPPADFQPAFPQLQAGEQQETTE
jgi:hypothetical protein